LGWELLKETNHKGEPEKRRVNKVFTNQTINDINCGGRRVVPARREKWKGGMLLQRKTQYQRV